MIKILEWLTSLFAPKKNTAMKEPEPEWSSGNYEQYAELKRQKQAENLAQNASKDHKEKAS